MHQFKEIYIKQEYLVKVKVRHEGYTSCGCNSHLIG